ncbi:MAG: 2-amino-4-hydroxy-6-hydroxymethyldihydropteridine diphosphokinase [Gammaproteobacteria bacterium]|nr:2-amino-4-hydroxy-6-hydroxymethyldihydropteridine diphosphokinase [Gammaproteobacteria bacterium]
MTPAYIGLGSNLQEPRKQLRRALAALRKLPASRLDAVSSLYSSAPVGPQDQPFYLNAVARLETELPPRELLAQMRRIERRQGRTREAERWQARTLDLDLLLYGDECIAGEELTVPHPEIGSRAFVLYPLYELAPELRIPGLGKLPALLPQVRGQRAERLGAERLGAERLGAGRLRAERLEGS